MIKRLRADGDEARAASVEVHDADPHVLTILDRGRTLGDPGQGGRSTTPLHPVGSPSPPPPVAAKVVLHWPGQRGIGIVDGFMMLSGRTCRLGSAANSERSS